MAVECSSSLTRRLALGVAGVALALLGGCVLAPVEPYEIGAPVVYSGAAYDGSVYYGAPTYYYGAPQAYRYWGPAWSLGFYGRYDGDRHWRGPRGGDGRHWRAPPPRGGSHWQRPPRQGGSQWQAPPGRGASPSGRVGPPRGGRDGGARRR